MLSHGILSLWVVGMRSPYILDGLSKGQVWRKVSKGLTTGPGHLGLHIPTPQPLTF